MKKTLRRGLVVTAVAAVGAGLLGTPAAQAAPNSYAYNAARWLEDQLVEGIADPTGFPDYGLTIDIYFTLKDLDTRATAQTRIIAALAENVDNYTTSGEFGPDDRYAGASGKLASAVQAAGGDPRSFGGVDLVERAEDLVMTEGSAVGRAKDRTAFGDFSNTIGQTWVVRALTTADTARAASTVDYLLKQQCDDGGVREVLADAQCTSPSGQKTTVDTTALAAQALVVARANGVAGLDDDIADATSWLLRQQANDGSFAADGAANANSTGLAAATLASLGQKGAAGSAASWLVGLQVTDAVAEDSALSNETGAVAFNRAALQEGLQSGITSGFKRDEWIRATAQAATGVNAQLSPSTAIVSAPTAYVSGGSTVAVRATGFLAGEKVRASVAGVPVAAKSAEEDGSVAFDVVVPNKTTTAIVSVTGSRANRSGSAPVKILASKKLTVSVTRPEVARGAFNRVNVKGLAEGEPVTVTYRGRVVLKGEATASGTFTGAFRVGTVTGRKTVYVKGLTATRQGTTTMTVVR